MMNTRIVVRSYGGAEVLDVLEETLRMPQEGEVRIKVQSAGVALADVMRRKGVYPMSPTPPFTPGYDAVGIIDEIGEDVQEYSLGEKVSVFFDGTGGYAEYVYAPVERVVRVPQSIDSSLAAATILNYVTAYQMLHRIAKVSGGENVLIHGASGGVGTALLELGKLAKLNLFGTASAVKHHTVASYGAIPIDYRNEDFVHVLRRIAPLGVDAVFDPIGGENWRRSIETLNKNGRFVGYGFTSVLTDAEPEDWQKDWKSYAEMKQTADGNAAYLYSITTLRKERPEWFREDLAVLLNWLEQGKINPLISHRIPLLQAGRAHQLLEDSQAIGKVVLIVS